MCHLAGDIREVDKNHEAKHDIERQAFIRIFSSIQTGEDFISLWEEFEDRKTEEAFFGYQ